MKGRLLRGGPERPLGLGAGHEAGRGQRPGTGPATRQDEDSGLAPRWAAGEAGSRLLRAAANPAPLRQRADGIYGRRTQTFTQERHSGGDPEEQQQPEVTR